MDKILTDGNCRPELFNLKDSLDVSHLKTEVEKELATLLNTINLETIVENKVYLDHSTASELEKGRFILYYTGLVDDIYNIIRDMYMYVRYDCANDTKYHDENSFSNENLHYRVKELIKVKTGRKRVSIKEIEKYLESDYFCTPYTRDYQSLEDFNRWDYTEMVHRYTWYMEEPTVECYLDGVINHDIVRHISPNQLKILVENLRLLKVQHVDNPNQTRLFE